MWCGPAPLRPFNAQDPSQGASATSSTTPTARSATGASTGSTRSSGGPDEKYPETVYSAGGRPIAGPPCQRRASKRPTRPITRSRPSVRDVRSCSWEHRQFRRQQRREGRKRRLLLLRHRRARSTWAGTTAGRSIRRTPTKAPIHEDAAAPRARRAEHQGAVRRLPRRDQAPARKPVCDIEIGHRSTNMACSACSR